MLLTSFQKHYILVLFANICNKQAGTKTPTGTKLAGVLYNEFICKIKPRKWYNFSVTREEFAKLVANALESLPAFFKEKLENVDVVVEEWPVEQVSKGRLLLGLYHGVPKTKRGAGYSFVLPDKITIFKGPIELVSRGNLEAIKNLVIDTVQHEIGHYFGISDARLKELKQ
jgi:predicted Zn-dependent protease with MMP-like domain